MAASLNEQETRFFAYVQAQARETVETGDLVRDLGLTPLQERKLLSRLSRRRLIARVRRGLYLVPSRLPVGGKWSPGAARALTALMQDRDAAYQICGPNAFSRYGWDEQIPNQIFAYNNRISGERQIAAISIILIKVAEERLGDSDSITTPDGIDLFYSSKVRSLLDAVYDWSRFNTLPRAYEWIRSEIRQDRSIAARLISVTVRYGNQGTIRRIGKLLEMEDIPRRLLRKLEKPLRATTSLIPWDPTQPKRGSVDRRWGVVLNND